MAFYPSSKPEGNHANRTHSLTLSFHFQTKVLIGIKQHKALHNSIQINTTQHNTKLEGYRHLHLHRLLQHPHIPSITL